VTADAVVLAMGIDGGIEGEGHDRMDIRFPGEQTTLIDAVLNATAKRGTPVVMLLFNGGNLAIEQYTSARLALVECWYPGPMGAQAVAEALYGVTNRWGKLPVTMYTYAFTQASDFVNLNMSDYPGRSYKYLAPDAAFSSYGFGFGLSLTTFSSYAFTAPSNASQHQGCFGPSANGRIGPQHGPERRRRGRLFIPQCKCSRRWMEQR